VTFEDAVKDLRKEFPGRVTTVSYAGLKFALEAGIDVWEFAETYSLQSVIRDHGLKEELIAGRWATELWQEDLFSWREAT
jgi:hypothetical protein